MLSPLGVSGLAHCESGDILSDDRLSDLNEKRLRILPGRFGDLEFGVELRDNEVLA